jgi:hypothetical protein
MSRFYLFLVLSLVVFGVSCEPVKTDALPVNTGSSDSSNVMTLPANTAVTDKVSETGISEETEKKLETVWWISPGKVYISNLFPGSQAEWNLRIHNEKDVANDYSVYYKIPDYTEQGYEKLPSKFGKWVILDSKITISPRSVGEELITIKMDKNDQASRKKYEVWIGVMDASQGGMIKTELCSRWFISTQ